MEQILQSLPVYMMIGIVVVIGVSQFNRIAGGILGVLFWSAVAIVGGYAYDRGGALGIGGVQFSRGVFYGMCAVLGALHGVTGFVAYTKRSARRRPTDDD